MTGWAFLALVLGTVAMEPLSRLTGSAWFLVPGAAGFLAILGLSWASLPRSVRLVAGLIPVGIAVLAVEAPGQSRVLETLRLPLFLVTFLWAMGLLREVSLRSSLMHAAGRALLGYRGRARFVLVSLGSMALSLVLLLSVVGLVGSMVMGGRETSGQGPTDDQRQALLALSRGYMGMIMISPLSMPFAVVIGAFGQADWLGMVPLIAPLLALFWLTGLALANASGAEAHQRTDTSKPAFSASDAADRRALLATLCLVAGIIGLVLVLQAVLAVRLVDAVIIGVTSVSLVWGGVQAVRRGRTAQRWSRRAPSPLTGGVADLVLLASAAFFGSAVAPHLPADSVAALVAAGDLPAWLVPLLIYAVFIGLGLVAIPPVLALVLISGIVPIAPALGLDAELVAATCMTAWAMTALSSPFNPATLALGRVAGLPSLTVSLGWNGRLIGVMGLAGAAWMGMVTQF